jgi:methyl-accepting chemotaxis protein
MTMIRHWTFARKISAGFAVIVTLAIVIGSVAALALRNVVASKDEVITLNGENLLDAEKLQVAAARRVVGVRGFLLERTEFHLDVVRTFGDEVRTLLGRLRARITAEDERDLLERVERSDAEHRVAIERLIALRKTDPPIASIVAAFDEYGQPKFHALLQSLDNLVKLEQQRRDAARQASTDAANSAIALVVGMAVLVLALATLIGVLLARALGQQIGTAVNHVQSSSSELQASANQQATGAREQATAMAEITTTITELLATSRQIAESAQRVAQIAEQTVGAARSGETTVDQAHESIAGIRRQVDLIVGHMLELGRKSQQIGAVLDIVSELAEQTNILAINATIEAAGAGDAGKRFAAVADEIRELADRVAGSTKEIRGLIDDVRSAVNTTVMATETGSKSVDTGSTQFGDVTAAFKQIAGLVATTTEAAREIELSTKQQASAVEQVNLAIASVAQTTRETEISTGQTLETVSQLAALSKDLLRLVQPQAAAA